MVEQPESPAEPEPEFGPQTDPESVRLARERAAWLEIVANYGERPTLGRLDDPDAPEEASGGVPPHPDESSTGAPTTPATTEWFHIEDTDADDAFVPEQTPPAELPEPPRLAAWLGVLGVPVLVVLAVILHSVTGFTPPAFVDALLLAWFLGGFGYLVATMRREDDDPYDDGARL